MRVAVRVVFPDRRVETWYLTTDHASSSHGLPVLVPHRGNPAYGPADLPSGTVLRMRSRDILYAEGARKAGYTVED